MDIDVVNRVNIFVISSSEHDIISAVNKSFGKISQQKCIFRYQV